MDAAATTVRKQDPDLDAALARLRTLLEAERQDDVDEGEADAETEWAEIFDALDDVANGVTDLQNDEDEEDEGDGAVNAKKQRTVKVSRSLIAALDNPMAQAAGIRKRDYSTDERTAMAGKGWALDDGSFPIANRDDLSNAIGAIGRAAEGKRDDVRAHIIRRAKALGAVDALPEDWNVAKRSTGVRDFGNW